MKSIALIVVSGGVAEVYEPLHVDCRIVDLDNIRAGEDPVFLPPGIGFSELCDKAGLENGRDYILTEKVDT